MKRFRFHKKVKTVRSLPLDFGDLKLTDEQKVYFILYGSRYPYRDWKVVEK